MNWVWIVEVLALLLTIITNICLTPWGMDEIFSVFPFKMSKKNERIFKAIGAILMITNLISSWCMIGNSLSWWVAFPIVFPFISALLLHGIAHGTQSILDAIENRKKQAAEKAAQQLRAELRQQEQEREAEFRRFPLREYLPQLNDLENQIRVLQPRITHQTYAQLMTAVMQCQRNANDEFLNEPQNRVDASTRMDHKIATLQDTLQHLNAYAVEIEMGGADVAVNIPELNLPDNM